MVESRESEQADEHTLHTGSRKTEVAVRSRGEREKKEGGEAWDEKRK